MIIKPELWALKKLYHPRRFGDKVLGRIPYPAQEIALLCPHPRKLNICGRGVGKSRVLESDKMVRMAAVLPYLLAALNGSDKPVPFRGILIASVKDQAFELQEAIKETFDRNEWLSSCLKPDSGKTTIKLKNGARILIRPATAAARGQHAQTMMTKWGVLQGAVVVMIEEAWFLRMPNFIAEVVEPMRLIGGKGSEISINSTPYGKSGEVWTIYSSASTGKCAQPFTLDANGRRVYQYDRSICHGCMRTYSAVLHNFPTWENPYANILQLIDLKKELCDSGRKATWIQEHEGTPESTAGMFFNERHQELMWDDDLPVYKLLNNGDWVVQTVKADKPDQEGGAVEEYGDLAALLGRSGSKFFIGVDPNQGIDSPRSDYAAISLVEVRGKKAFLRMCQRWQVPPPTFNGRSYTRRDMTQFLIDLTLFLVHTANAKKVFVDQGFGQAVWNAVKETFGENRVAYITGSEKGKNEALLNFRGVIECDNFKAPPIQFLVEETKYLQLVQDALIEDKVKIQKAEDWGTKGAQVDGLFATAYAMMGTVQDSVIVIGGSYDQLDLTQVVGTIRDLPFAMRDISPN